jgi:hypothetical protein
MAGIRANDCDWFVPIVKRMAAGETVPHRDIEAAYLAHNGRPLPHGPYTEVMA